MQLRKNFPIPASSHVLTLSVPGQYIHQFKSIPAMLHKWKVGDIKLRLADQASRVRLQQASSSWLVQMLLCTVSGQHPTCPAPTVLLLT